MDLKLERFAYHPAGVLGRLYLPDGSHLFTVERPWLGNQPFFSCIPEGVYELWPFNGRRFKNVWQVMNVPERSAILIHAGNFPSDLQGCIAIGDRLLESSFGVANSRKALKRLREALGSGEHQIEITHYTVEYP